MKPPLHSLSRRLAFVFTLVLFAQAARADFADGGKREFPLSCNGVPCVIDTAAHSVYCCVKPVETDSMKLVFSSDSISNISINFHRHYMGDTITLPTNFRRSYRMRFGSAIQIWTLYITPLPIVMIEASNYETWTFHHGYINIIDPWKRTKGLVHFQHFIGVRIRGAYTAGLAKKSYAVKLWDSNREGKNVSVLGLMKDDNLILDAMYNDKARMRNRLCFDLWNQVDSLPYEVSEGHSRLNGTEGLYVEVFVDGGYNGLYCLTDKINRKKLDLEKVDSNSDGSIDYHGMLYKAVDWSDETRFNNLHDDVNTTNTLGWCNWEQKYPDDSAAMANWTPLKNLIKFTTPATNSNNLYFAGQLRNKYYLQNLTNLILFVNVLHINDNNCKNTYVSFRDINDSPSRALLTPWDLDASFGREWNGSLLDSLGFGKQVNSCGLFSRLVNNGPYYFRENFHDTWIRWKNGPFSLDSVKARIISKRELLYNSGAWKRENARWPDSMGGIITETDYMIDWYARSMAYTDSILADFPSDINDVRYNSESAIAVTAEDGCISVQWQEPQGGRVLINVYAADGTLIESQESTLPFKGRKLSHGVYVVSVKASGASVRKKVLIK